MKPITGPVQAVPPTSDNQAPTTPDHGPRQLVLRLLAWVEGCQGIPPERALWRETLDLAMPQRPRDRVRRLRS